MQVPTKQDPKPPVLRLTASADEVAEMLGVSPRTIFKLTKTGEIPHKRLGSRIVYPLDAIKRYLNEPNINN